MPVVVGVAAFHLMRGGGAAPAKSGWEVENLFGQRSLLGLRIGVAVMRKYVGDLRM